MDVENNSLSLACDLVMEEQLKDIIKSKEEKLLHEKERIISHAKEEAARILERGKKEAQSNAHEIYEKAKEKGYKEGLAKGSKEIEEKKNQLKQSAIKQKEEYENLIKDLEPKFAKLTVDLLKKITGVIIKDKSVIEHLIGQALVGENNSKEFIIRISGEDYELVKGMEDKVHKLLDKDKSVSIMLDENLKKNQCVIETDHGIIDCSLDTQLDSLCENIKLLANC